MRARRLGIAAGVAAVMLAGCATASVGPDDGGGEGGGPVSLTFQSLAFQEPSVAATRHIVEDWNAANPDVQVEYVQGSWDSVHDQLVTQFQGGTAPDVIHDESADITGFARQGYLADLGPHLAGETRSAVPEGIWEAVTVDGQVVAAPTLLQSYVVFANTALLEQAGVALPTGPTWSWDELAAAARQATTPTTAGLGWGLRQPTATVMSMGLNFGGTFFTGSGDTTAVQIGDAELEVPRRTGTPSAPTSHPPPCSASRRWVTTTSSSRSTRSPRSAVRAEAQATGTRPVRATVTRLTTARAATPSSSAG
ncbi:ABC transporter substrate-binding protein [Pseudonocardia nigra]|uniref:ABC transporter substrate-binding protein n=1 Tax=Pseudonocardia nigra TaxID=1921578 RepID=UPI001C6047E3|nr:extracellular solute-binding protein [Pseudonocardia nigra]